MHRCVVQLMQAHSCCPSVKVVLPALSVHVLVVPGHLRSKPHDAHHTCKHRCCSCRENNVPQDVAGDSWGSPRRSGISTGMVPVMDITCKARSLMLHKMEHHEAWYTVHSAHLTGTY